jgi:hypothetical protein
VSETDPTRRPLRVRGEPIPPETLRDAVKVAIIELALTDCVFDMCDRPESGEPTPMLTCRVCTVRLDLMKALKE